MIPLSNRKILPLKHKFFTFQSQHEYGNEFTPTVLQIRTKNPKWCHLSLKLGGTEEYKEYSKLRQAKSLRLRSVHLESFYIDSEEGDRINEYSGELDVFARAGHTLKKLTLSVIHEDNLDARYRLKKFVKKQKHLDELGFYLGDQGSHKIYDLLIYIGKSVKTLTMGNLVFDSVFDDFQFPKLETLRFEYVQFLENENTFDFKLLSEALDQIFALPSLKALTFSQYQHYVLYTPDDESNENESGSEEEEEDEEEEEEEEEDEEEDEDEDEAEEEEEEDKDEKEGPYFRSEIPLKFWEKLKAKLDEDKDKPLKIKYHKKDDKEIEKKVEHFKRIFGELPPSQTFEYEITQFKSHPEDVENGNNFDVSWTGIRYLISLDQVESI